VWNQNSCFWKKTKIEINCHFRFKLIKIRLEVSLIFKIETIFLKNYIQNWILIPFMCRIGIEIEIVLSCFLSKNKKFFIKIKNRPTLDLTLRCIINYVYTFYWLNICEWTYFDYIEIYCCKFVVSIVVC